MAVIAMAAASFWLVIACNLNLEISKCNPSVPRAHALPHASLDKLQRSGWQANASVLHVASLVLPVWVTSYPYELLFTSYLGHQIGDWSA